MKTNFIKTTEEGKSLEEVFGTEVLENLSKKLIEIVKNSSSFKESALTIKEELTKEELTTVCIVVLSNMNNAKQFALSLASSEIGEEFEFNPKGDENTVLVEALGLKNIMIPLNRINGILGETEGQIGKTAEKIYETMSTEEIIYSVLFLL